MPRSKPPSKAKKPAKPSRAKSPAKKTPRAKKPAKKAPARRPHAPSRRGDRSPEIRRDQGSGAGTAANRGRFQPGKSGNPGGRPKLEGRIRELAQSYGEAAVETLAKLLRHRNPKIKLGAAEALLNRGFGRPPQAIQMSFLQGELAQRIAALTDDEKRQVAQGDVRPLVARG